MSIFAAKFSGSVALKNLTVPDGNAQQLDAHDVLFAPLDWSATKLIISAGRYPSGKVNNVSPSLGGSAFRMVPLTNTMPRSVLQY